jgi:hypothetical protein
MPTKIFNLSKYALVITIGAAMLAACGNNGGSSFAPSGTSSGMPGIAHIGGAAMPAKSKGNGTYQYISNFGAADVSEFDYPKSDAQIGTISGIESVQGECTDALFGSGKQTFWLVSSVSAAGTIDEFKVGGSGGPIKVLMTPGDTPVACAMDPATGNLVATSIANGHVDLFKGAKGSAIQLTPPLVEAFSAAYDNKSNLYVDGFNSSGSSVLVELKKGSNKWKTLTLSNAVEFPGKLQYDGKYMTVNDQEANAIYGYTCRGTTCTLKRTVSVSCGGSWIAKGYVICVDVGNNDAVIVKYPAGGSPIATLKGSFSEPLASVQVEK